MSAIASGSVGAVKLRKKWPTPARAKPVMSAAILAAAEAEMSDGARVAPHLGQFRLQYRALRGVSRGRFEGVARVAADRVPAVTQPGDAAQGHLPLTPDPDRRTRLLNRLGIEAEVGKAHVLSGEARCVARQQLVEGGQELVRHLAALGERRRREGAEFLVEPADSDADREPAARQHVDGGQGLGGQYRWTLRHHQH